jgi:uncharacterized membrane-anchored protein YjiN (DUF445 family)
MALVDKIEDLLTEFGKQLVIDTQKSLKSKQRDSSLNSRLSTSIKPQTTYESGKIVFRLTMNDYWDAVNSGRDPTSKGGDGSLRKNLIRWIKTRKLKVEISKRKTEKATTLKNKKVKKSYKKQTYEQAVESVAYAIAKKIHKEGYEGNNFFDEVINDGRIEKLQSEITELVKDDIIIEIRSSYT